MRTFAFLKDEKKELENISIETGPMHETSNLRCTPWYEITRHRMSQTPNDVPFGSVIKFLECRRQSDKQCHLDFDSFEEAYDM